MRAQYDALVRQSGAFAYWPLGRNGFVDVVGGRHFNNPPLRIVEGDGVRLAEEVATRAAVSTVTNNFSIEIWVYREHTVSGRWIFTNGVHNSNGYHIAYTADTTGRFRAATLGTLNLANSANPLLPFTWNHIVVVRDANVWKYYLNGELDTANAGTSSPSGISGANTQVGSTAGVGGVDGYRAAAFYTNVLTAEEVRAHYLEGISKVGPTPFVGEYYDTVAVEIEATTIPIKISVSSAQEFAATDAATVPIKISPSATFQYFEAATIFVNLQFTGGECYSTFSGLMMEGEADPRWMGSETATWWVYDSTTRWEIGDIQVEGVNC